MLHLSTSLPEKNDTSAERLFVAGRKKVDQSVIFVVWESDGAWLGYLQEYPDYWTQGKNLRDLKAHLKDLYRDITSGEFPGIQATRQ